MVAGVLSLIMCFRMFEYLHFQKKLAVITETFTSSFSEMFHLFVVLAFTIQFFALAAFLCFGSEVKAYSTYGQSVWSTWQMCMGMWKPTKQEERYGSLVLMEVYMFMFKLIITLMLLKMVLAIIFESYKKTVGGMSKKTQSVALDLWELTSHFMDWVGSASPKSNFVSPDQMRLLVKNPQCTKTSYNWTEIVDRLNDLFPGEGIHISAS